MNKFLTFLTFVMIGLGIVILTLALWTLHGTKAHAAEVNENDLYILEHLICGEAEGCSWDMKISVGSVVLNRVSDSRFPDSIEEVVFQPGQYACTWDGNYYKEPSEDTHKAALYLLENGSQIDESVVWQAEFKQGYGVYDKIGSMYFCF